jgi:hypothetical protein
MSSISLTEVGIILSITNTIAAFAAWNTPETLGQLLNELK